MAYSIKDKVDLRKISHSVRAAQAVLQYGVGAMVDFPDQTLITAAPETWSETRPIRDDRFAKALGVDHFALPTNISYARFPEWYFCPKCRRFQSLGDWIAEYQKYGGKSDNRDPYLIRYVRCYKCRQDLVVARVVTVCERGHLNDFPWVKWVHKHGNKPICDTPALTFKTGASGSEGLEGLNISCSCGAWSSLKGAFHKDCFEKLDQGSGSAVFRCEGNHPHMHVKQECSCYPRTVQRGSSSIYFPVVYRSLVIPPYSELLNTRIESSSSFQRHEVVLGEMAEEREAILEKYFPQWVEGIASEIRASKINVESILKRKWFAARGHGTDVTSVKYRAEEYEALSGEVSSPAGSGGDFVREEIHRELFGDKLPYIRAISLIEKVRVVSALVGFSRLNPVSSKDDAGFVHVKSPKTRWYPAYEVRGEGIFIEFEQAAIDEWIAANPMVMKRAKTVDDNYARSFIGQSRQRTITPKFLLLHTMSHLLIKQLSFECGYSITSLSERIYSSEKGEDKQMAGIFIYTANGDSEGTLGGLVRQGRPDAFPQIFKKAIGGAKTCSNDPVCILSHGQGRESLNLAACHACALLPETCCEERNGFLDRGVIIGTYHEPQLGFYSLRRVPIETDGEGRVAESKVKM